MDELPWLAIQHEYCHASLPGEVSTAHNSSGRGQLEVSDVKLSWTLSFVLLPFSSVQPLSHPNSLRPHKPQHARPPCPPPTPRVHTDSCASSQWCHPAISPSVVPFSSCLQSLPAWGSFPMSQLFAWGGQSIGVLASASAHPKNTQDWSPLGWTGWISLQSKGLSRVFSNTTVQNHQLFCTQLSYLSLF